MEISPFSSMGFFDQEKNLLFEGKVDNKGFFDLSKLFDYNLKQLPTSIAICNNDVNPYFVMFPAVDNFTEEEAFVKAVEGTIMGDTPPLDKNIYLMIHGIKNAWYRLEIIIRDRKK